MQLQNCSTALLWAYKISPNRAGIELPLDALSDALLEAENNQDYLWIHLQSDILDASELLQQIGLSETVIDGLLAQETRPRTMAVNAGTLLYLRGINRNPNASPEDMVSVRIWFNQKLIITARREERKLTSIQTLREHIVQQHTPELSSPSTLVLKIITNIADTILETIDNMDDALSNFETQNDPLNEDRQTLSAIRLQAATLRRYLAPQRDALESLYRLPGILSDEQTFELREQIDRISRYVEDIDLLRERTIVLQDELRNCIAERQGVRMYLLSIVTAIFLPLSFLTGVFGMNVGGLPGVNSDHAFVYLVTAMGALAVGVFIAMLWKRWL